MEKTDWNKFDQEIIALALEGRTPAEIAYKFDLTCAYVIKVLVKNQIPAKFDYTGKARPSTYGKLPVKRKKVKKSTAGHSRNKKVGSKRYSEEYLLNHLRELSINLGRAPRVSDIIDAGIVNASVYRIRFGSLFKAKQATGFFSDKKRNPHKYSDKYLLYHLKELSKTTWREHLPSRTLKSRAKSHI